jgi:hypothetical protein
MKVVAIVQKLIDGDAAFDPRPPFGPPDADNLLLNSDGTLICCGSEATPSPLEAGILLQGLTPAGIVRATGGLRYTIARALLEVDAAPVQFGSRAQQGRRAFRTRGSGSAAATPRRASRHRRQASRRRPPPTISPVHSGKPIGRSTNCERQRRPHPRHLKARPACRIDRCCGSCARQ